MQVKDLIKKVKQIEIRSRKKTDASLIGQYHSAFKGQGMTFAEVRQYQTGDDIRRIDWNKTARFQEPFVKIMEEERELTMIFLVDISASMDYGTKTALKREFVAEICASLGFSAIQNNDKVGLILYADKIYKIIPPQKGKKHLLAIISQLLSTDYLATKTNLDKALEHTLNLFKRKAMLFIFSDFNDDFEEKTLKITSQKHQLFGIRIFDGKEEEIPDVGYALFQDAETGKEIWANTSSPRFKRNYNEQQIVHINKIGHSFERSSAPLLNIQTGADYVKSLYQAFKRK